MKGDGILYVCGYEYGAVSCAMQRKRRPRIYRSVSAARSSEASDAFLLINFKVVLNIRPVLIGVFTSSLVYRSYYWYLLTFCQFPPPPPPPSHTRPPPTTDRHWILTRSNIGAIHTPAPQQTCVTPVSRHRKWHCRKGARCPVYVD